jgi:hypothetical protein
MTYLRLVCAALPVIFAARRVLLYHSSSSLAGSTAYNQTSVPGKGFIKVGRKVPPMSSLLFTQKYHGTLSGTTGFRMDYRWYNSLSFPTREIQKQQDTSANRACLVLFLVEKGYYCTTVLLLQYSPPVCSPVGTERQQVSLSAWVRRGPTLSTCLLT